jgi:hypothetical protein
MLREIAAGTVLVFVLLGLACGSGLSPVVRCKLEAVRVLPDDPMQATVYDAVDVIERLRACHRLEADGGP